MVTFVKGLFGYDDALDAFGVHGAGGTIGALLTGVFAKPDRQRRLSRRARTGAAGRLAGRQRSQIGYQLVGILIAWSFALVGTIVPAEDHRPRGRRAANEAQEIEGLDLTEHGEEAYNLRDVTRTENAESSAGLQACQKRRT